MIRFGSLSALLIVLGFASLPHAQSQKPTFEVASVKRYTGSFGVDAMPGLFPRIFPGGVLRAGNTPLIELIKLAYGVSEYQIAGGPGWISNEYFAIEARGSSAATPEQMRLMLRTLLEDRFALRVRIEPRDLRHFVLRMANQDGRIGPYMVRMPDDCNTSTAAAVLAKMPSRPRPSASVISEVRCGTMSAIVDLFARNLEAPVVDKTGLSGKWTLQIYFDSEKLLAHEPGLASFPAALQEQLGLKLEASRDPIDVLVIDSVQQPTEN